ncbi:MAG TPA: hypothetical protein VE291_01665 [Terracidiphilus sp.]|nr:hypothetical protein [Terracidiphilus sp.]
MEKITASSFINVSVARSLMRAAAIDEHAAESVHIPLRNGFSLGGEAGDPIVLLALEKQQGHFGCHGEASPNLEVCL